MHKILILNGPNLNLLGLREPHLYGSRTLDSINRDLARYARRQGVEARFFQSNHEGALIDQIHMARTRYDGLICNMAAYTHTSVAILDALKAVALPVVEVHLTDPARREPFRHHSFVAPAAFLTIQGKGEQGYFEAVDAMKAYLTKQTAEQETNGLTHH